MDEHDDTQAVVTKVKPDLKKYDLHVKMTGEHGKKLEMLVRETGRCRRDIIERLLDMAKVGEYTE
tara:strand:- start:1506 stop:1700 length:195 start_codon:yes stop_codon:yes gene_type:complete